MFNKNIKKTAYGLLARREHSQKELRQKLLLRDYAAEEIEPILLALQEQNIQSDVRFAESLIRVRISKGYGWIYICAELKQKGLANDIISEIYQHQSVDWFAQAKLAYQKRFADTPISDQKDKAKRIRFLQSRGFDYEQISATLNLD